MGLWVSRKKHIDLTRPLCSFRMVPATDLVRGDLVELHCGDNVPADIRIFREDGERGVHLVIVHGKDMSLFIVRAACTRKHQILV